MPYLMGGFPDVQTSLRVGVACAEAGARPAGLGHPVPDPPARGPTGERNELPPELERTVDRVRAATRLPVAVGFGIASAEQASRVADLADGVIVGSRLVRAAGEGGPRAVGEAVAELSAALR